LIQQQKPAAFRQAIRKGRGASRVQRTVDASCNLRRGSILEVRRRPT
jgi:hypothetical protein